MVIFSFVIPLVILLFSVVLHEVSHGAVAGMLGDPTARLLGRLTLNPLKHLDPIGSVVLPLTTAFLGGPVFGWAKPVPYNPYNLRNGKRGEVLVAAAGPATNLLLALIFGLTLRAMVPTILHDPTREGVVIVLSFIAQINLLLGIFNLVPIPPLDGSKFLFAFLPKMSAKTRFFLERNGFLFLVLFIFFGFQVITPVIALLFQLITGISAGMP